MDGCVKKAYLLLLAGLLMLAGCAKPQPYDYSALERSKPASILVLPPLNNSVEVNAPYTFLSTITRPLAEKGYYVFPVAVIDRLMKENGLTSAAEMQAVPLKKLSEYIGADAVLYVTIEDWGQKYQVLSSRTVVQATMKLVDSKSGDLLWDANVKAVQASGDGGNGLAGALVGAIVEQIAGSLADKTPALSRQALNASINNKESGLLNGPRAPAISH